MAAREGGHFLLRYAFSRALDEATQGPMVRR